MYELLQTQTQHLIESVHSATSLTLPPPYQRLKLYFIPRSKRILESFVPMDC